MMAHREAIALTANVPDDMLLFGTGEIRHLIHAPLGTDRALNKLQSYLRVEVLALQEGSDEGEGGVQVNGTTTVERVRDTLVFLRWQPDEELDVEHLYRVDIIYSNRESSSFYQVERVRSREEVDWGDHPLPHEETPELFLLSDAARDLSISLVLESSFGVSIWERCCVHAHRVEGPCGDVRTWTEYSDCELEAHTQRHELHISPSLSALEDAASHGWVTWWEIDDTHETKLLSQFSGQESDPFWRFVADLDTDTSLAGCSRLFALNPDDPSEVMEGDPYCFEREPPEAMVVISAPNPGAPEACTRRSDRCLGATGRWCSSVQRSAEYREARQEARDSRRASAAGGSDTEPGSADETVDNTSAEASGDATSSGSDDSEGTSSAGVPPGDPHADSSGCNVSPSGAPSPVPLFALALLITLATLRQPLGACV